MTDADRGSSWVQPPLQNGDRRALRALLYLAVGAFGVLNLIRGRPFFGLPREVGRLELAAFVIVPALLPEIFGGQATSAVVTALVNLALLGLVYAVVGLALVPMVIWAAGNLIEQLTAALVMLTRDRTLMGELVNRRRTTAAASAAAAVIIALNAVLLWHTFL